MKSMTGYAYKEKVTDEFSISIEIKSVNNRYLDLYVQLPGYLNPLEPAVKEFLSGKIQRGKIDIIIRYKDFKEKAVITCNEEAVKESVQVLNRVRKAAGIRKKIVLQDLIHIEGLLVQNRTTNTEEVFERIQPLLEEVFSEYEKSRIREGKTTEKDIRRNLNTLDLAAKEIGSRAGELENKIIENVREKFRQVLGDEVDQQRIMAETAMLLVKYSISEEIGRMRAHLDSFSDIIDKDEACGKKLDFLCQEINREFNTAGSKSIILEVNQAVIQAKDALENIREQLRNVE